MIMIMDDELDGGNHETNTNKTKTNSLETNKRISQSHKNHVKIVERDDLTKM